MRNLGALGPHPQLTRGRCNPFSWILLCYCAAMLPWVELSINKFVPLRSLPMGALDLKSKHFLSGPVFTYRKNFIKIRP